MHFWKRLWKLAWQSRTWRNAKHRSPVTHLNMNKAKWKSQTSEREVGCHFHLPLYPKSHLKGSLPFLKAWDRSAGGALCSSSHTGKKNCTCRSVIIDCPLRAGARQDKTKLLWQQLEQPHISLSLPMITCVTASVCSFCFFKEKPEHGAPLSFSFPPLPHPSLDSQVRW